MNRRGFIAALAGLPLIGKLIPGRVTTAPLAAANAQMPYGGGRGGGKTAVAQRMADDFRNQGYQVVILTRSGYTTAPSPPTEYWPIGPRNTVTRAEYFK